MHLKLHFLDFEFPALITRVAAPNFYMQVIAPPQMMADPLGRADKFPGSDKWGMVLNLTFVLEKKDAPKLEFGKKYSIEGCMNVPLRFPRNSW